MWWKIKTNDSSLFFLMIRRPPGSTQGRSSAASDVYKRQVQVCQKFLTENEDERVAAVKLVKESNLRTREEYLGKASSKKVLTPELARTRKFNCDWTKSDIAVPERTGAVSYTHLRAHETHEHLVCRLLLEKKKQNKYQTHALHNHTV